MVAPKKIPPLSAVRVFESAARHGSFARAAAELNVTPAAVSHQVKQLEHWLRTPLFVRSPNGVVLTVEGREYSLKIRDAFHLLMMESADTREKRRKPIITVRAQITSASHWLTAKLCSYRRLRPNVELSIFGLPERYEIKVAANLWMSEQAELTGYRSTPLFDMKFGVYASPEFLSATSSGKPSPTTVRRNALIHTISTLNPADPTFDDWFVEAGLRPVQGSRGLHVNLFASAITACELGNGFALLPDRFVEDAVAKGRLVFIEGPEISSSYTTYLHLLKSSGSDAQELHNWLLKVAHQKSSGGAKAKR